MNFQKLLSCLAITLVSVTTVIAQDTIPAPAKCFPSGTSLIAAQRSPSGRYLALYSVQQLWKVFDLTTGKLVSKAKKENYTQEIEPYMNDLVQRLDRYGYQRRRVTAQIPTEGVEIVDRIAHYQVVQSVDVPLAHSVAVNPRTGDLVVSSSKEWYWFPFGAQKKQLKMKNKPRDLSYEYFFSNDGKYVLTKWGDRVDFEKGTVSGNAFAGVTGTESFGVTMNADNKTYSMSGGTEAINVYELATGKLIETIPVPKDLPRIQGFEIMPLGDPHSFVYWLNFNNRAASGGLAYYVKDGVPLSLCDPDWMQEQTDNLVGLLREWKAKEDAEEKHRRELAAEYERRKKERDAYLKSHPEARNSKPVPQPKYVTSTYTSRCSYCNGTGSITYELLTPGAGRTSRTVYSVDVYGNRKYVTNNYGYETKKCTACRGSGQIKVTSTSFADHQDEDY